MDKLTVLVTRPSPQGEALCALIERGGGKAIHLPTLAFAPPPDEVAFLQAVELLGAQDWLIFISPQAVYASVPTIRRRWPVFPSTVRFAAVGEGTAKALSAAGYTALYPHAEWNSEGILGLSEFQAIKGKKIAIVRGVGGREHLDKQLAASGATILPVIAYQRVLPAVPMREYLELLKKGKLDRVVCTSYESVRNLKKMVGIAGWLFLKKIPLVVVSERIKQLAQGLGFETIWVTPKPSNEAILAVLEKGKSG